MSGALRVMVHDAWDTLVLPWNGEQSVRDLKREALERVRLPGPAADYLVKLRGAELRDEGATLAAAGVPVGGSVIVLHRTRRPVR